MQLVLSWPACHMQVPFGTTVYISENLLNVLLTLGENTLGIHQVEILG